LKERYSAIEECKADILSMYNHLHLLNLKEFDANMIRKAQATYLAGLLEVFASVLNQHMQKQI